ncbi:KCTD9 [Branchiostoma lanceolatum]|uniref:KCTD9 protein n=1 Tax=Branchiostoma lanceolatum TaxID=7740 RepID=A0A8J9W8N4_BRALA|nr:KCTD9 [Branchiostoma lanceolatum]
MATPRVTLFVNRSREKGCLCLLPSDMEELLKIASLKLTVDAKKLYTEQGALVDEIEVIRDNDVLFVSAGEPFFESKTNRKEPTRTCHNGAFRQRAQVSHELAGPSQTDWISVNVGGTLFTTTRSTLVTKEPESMLARMFDDESTSLWSHARDDSGAYLIDRSPLYFEPILNFLRHGRLILNQGVNPEGVLEEAKFFGIFTLVEILEDIIKSGEPVGDGTPLTRHEFVRILIATPSNRELRMQGINFSGADLSKLDLRYINFKQANFHNADLSGANLASCSLERADLSKAVLEGANLQGVKMVCANLEGAAMRGCNFEDPTGLRANMEGCNMKGVDLECSQMGGVNLRVATLKNASLQNCNLRGAILAGTDLENCNLTGCDLQDANLRGANVKGATFEEMLTPIHMSQSVR